MHTESEFSSAPDADGRRNTSILAVGGGAGAGKSTVAEAVAARLSGSVVLHLDEYYHTDVAAAPSVARFDGAGRIVNLSHPDSIDEDRLKAELDRHRETSLLIVEGTFALYLACIRDRAEWLVFVNTPADIRIVRKTLRKISEGHDPSHVLRGYLEQGRQAHDLYVLPTRQAANLILDGTLPVDEQVNAVLRLLLQ